MWVILCAYIVTTDIFFFVIPGNRNVKNIDLVYLHWKLGLLCQIYTMYILIQKFKPENKTDNSDFTKYGMKIGPVPDEQEKHFKKNINIFDIFLLQIFLAVQRQHPFLQYRKIVLDVKTYLSDQV